METLFDSFQIKAVSSCLPNEPIMVSDFGKVFGENEVKRIAASSGVHSIYSVKSNQGLTDLCERAANDLLFQQKIDAKSIDAIIVVTQTSEFVAPATSAILQSRLNLNQNVLAFDINYGCSGYIYGLYQAALLIKAAHCKNVLLLAGDAITPLIDPEDRKLKLLLSDAATASLITPGKHKAGFILKTDGNGSASLMAKRKYPASYKTNKKDEFSDGFYRMNGSDVMAFALREVPKVIDDGLENMDWQKDEVDFFALHQANQFMLQYLIRKSNLPKDKTPIGVANVGNTGPASIPLLMSMMADELKEKSLNKSILCGFGVGLSWGSAAVNLSKTDFHQPVHL